MTLIVFALASAVAIYIVMLKLGLVKLFRNRSTRRAADGGLDLIVSGAMVLLFAGTFSGMMTGLLVGLFVSGLLFMTRLVVKPKKAELPEPRHIAKNIRI